MKKEISILLFVLLLLTGCGSEKKELDKDIASSIDIDEKDAKLVCTTNYDYSELDYVIGSKYVVFANDEGLVTKVVSREIIESNDQTKLDDFQSYLSENHEAAKEYDGYESNIKHTDKRVISDVTIDYSKFDMEKFVADNADAGKDIIELTLDKIEAQYISLGATCERK